MKNHELEIPLRDDDLEKLALGDAVYLTGIIYTGREGLYRTLYDEGRKLPYPIDEVSNVNFHCSPAIGEEEGRYTITSVTATASFRFAHYIGRFIEDFGVKAIIGKSGMPMEVYRNAFVPNRAVYLSTIGYGAGAIYGRCIEAVERVVWKEELGLAQAVWLLKVKRFGPLLVESDLQGHSLFAREHARINARFEPLYRGLEPPILRRVGEELDPFGEMI